MKTASIFGIAIITTWFGGCTNYTKTHVIKWSGVFMIDSITAGAVRLEYREEVPINNTYAGGRTYGINQKLFFYNFRRDSLFLYATLNSSLAEIPVSQSDKNDVDFNYPLLMYITNGNGNTVTSIYNIETKSNVLSTPFRGFLSSGCKYLVGVRQIMNLNTLDSTGIENSNYDALFYFNDTIESAYGVATDRRKSPFPVFKYGLGGVLPESLGVLNLYETFGRSPLNGKVVYQVSGKAEIGLLNLDSLKKNIIVSDFVSMGNAFSDMGGFDYSIDSENFILFKNVGLGGNDPGLYVGNLKNAFSLKNISPTIYQDE
jgi:hypothetical protein